MCCFFRSLVNYAQGFQKMIKFYFLMKFGSQTMKHMKLLKTFKKIKIGVENPYFNEIKSRLSLLKTDKKSESLDTILYLCEPLMPPIETKI